MIKYTLNDTEEKSLNKFNEKHYKKCKSGIQVILIDTGIGLNVKVQCCECKKIKDISDYKSW